MWFSGPGPHEDANSDVRDVGDRDRDSDGDDTLAEILAAIRSPARLYPDVTSILA